MPVGRTPIDRRRDRRPRPGMVLVTIFEGKIIAVERHGPGDHEEARTLLHTARPDAERMTMHGWLQQADTALAVLT